LFIVRKWGWDLRCSLLAMLKVFFVHAQKVCSELFHHGKDWRVLGVEMVREWWREGLLACAVV
jgi:hypothetical protein